MAESRTNGRTAAPDRLDRQVWTVAAVVVVGAIMSILDTTIVNVALETLARDLHSSLSEVQWVATGYLLALATVIPLSGWMSERFGPKRVWMTSVALFVVGSMLCGLAWDTSALIVFRVLQGFGGGMVMPIGMILLTQTAGPQRVGRVMSVIGVPMLLGPVLGPVIGGLIVQHFSWRWIFYVNVPIGALGLAMGARLLPAGRTSDNPGRLDWRGLLLLSPGLGLIVYGLAEVSSKGGIASVGSWGPIAGGILLVALFALRALRTERPLIDLRLFRNREFSAAAAATFVIGAALFGTLLLLPLFYQVARGESPLSAGLLLAPQGLGAALVMPVSGRLTDRVGGGRVAIVGLLVMLLGTFTFTQLGPHTSYGLLEASLVIRGIGLGGTMMPAMAAAYAALDRAEVPRATSALNVIQRVGGSIGTAVLAVVLQEQLRSGLPGVGAGGGIAAAGNIPPSMHARLAVPLAHAFATTFWWSFALTAAGLVPAVLLARVSRRARSARASEPEHEQRVPVEA